MSLPLMALDENLDTGFIPVLQKDEHLMMTTRSM
jgi:hypothetical protein